MDQPEPHRDQGASADEPGRSTTTYQDHVSDATQANTSSYQCIRIWLWKHVFRRFTVARIEAACGIAIVAITTFYTYYARQQATAAIAAAKAATDAANAAISQTEAAKIQMMASERAWVTVKSAKVEELNLIVGLHPTVSVEIQNTGHSPALNSISISAAGITATLPPGDSFPMGFFTSQKPLAKYVIGPSASLTLPNQIGRGLTADEISMLKSGGTERTVFVFGYVKYDDIFKRQHTTTFCFRTYHGYQLLAPCDKWNSAN